MTVTRTWILCALRWVVTPVSRDVWLCQGPNVHVSEIGKTVPPRVLPSFLSFFVDLVLREV